jgi:hypothetical protein
MAVKITKFSFPSPSKIYKKLTFWCKNVPSGNPGSLSSMSNLFKRYCHAAEKLEAIARATRCRSSQLTGCWTRKEYLEKWRAKGEERHKGWLTPKKFLIINSQTDLISG